MLYRTQWVSFVNGDEPRVGIVYAVEGQMFRPNEITPAGHVAVHGVDDDGLTEMEDYEDANGAQRQRAIVHVLPVSHVAPVTEREQIPAKRLATYDPKWQPGQAAPRIVSPGKLSPSDVIEVTTDKDGKVIETVRRAER